MRAAMPLLLRYAFDDLGLHRVQANVQPGERGLDRARPGRGIPSRGFAPVPVHPGRLAGPRAMGEARRRRAPLLYVTRPKPPVAELPTSDGPERENTDFRRARRPGSGISVRSEGGGTRADGA